MGSIRFAGFVHWSLQSMLESIQKEQKGETTKSAMTKVASVNAVRTGSVKECSPIGESTSNAESKRALPIFTIKAGH